MATTPQYATTPRAGAGLLTTADTSYTAPTTIATILTAGTNGTKINRIFVRSMGNSVAGLLRIFLHDGSTYHMVDEFAVTAITASTTASAYSYEKFFPDLVVPTGWSVRATTSVAQTGLKVTVIGADL